jgi:hypothetical protein
MVNNNPPESGTIIHHDDGPLAGLGWPLVCFQKVLEPKEELRRQFYGKAGALGV